jgi:hypothetical protein
MATRRRMETRRSMTTWRRMATQRGMATEGDLSRIGGRLLLKVDDGRWKVGSWKLRG